MDFCHQHKIIPKTKLITYKELDKVNLKQLLKDFMTNFHTGL